MKKFLSLLLLLSSLNSFAIDAPGEVFYKSPTDNNIVFRDMVLEVPARGQGDVFLRTPDSSYKIKANKFWTHKCKQTGKVTFFVLFKKNKEIDGKMMIVKKLFKGAYIRGNNKAVYYGNFFYSKKQTPAEEEVENEELEKLDHHQFHRHFKYGGGFWFSADVE